MDIISTKKITSALTTTIKKIEFFSFLQQFSSYQGDKGSSGERRTSEGDFEKSERGVGTKQVKALVNVEDLELFTSDIKDVDGIIIIPIDSPTKKVEKKVTKEKAKIEPSKEEISAKTSKEEIIESVKRNPKGYPSAYLELVKEDLSEKVEIPENPLLNDFTENYFSELIKIPVVTPDKKIIAGQKSVTINLKDPSKEKIQATLTIFHNSYLIKFSNGQSSS